MKRILIVGILLFCFGMYSSWMMILGVVSWYNDDQENIYKQSISFFDKTFQNKKDVKIEHFYMYYDKCFKKNLVIPSSLSLSFDDRESKYQEISKKLNSECIYRYITDSISLKDRIERDKLLSLYGLSPYSPQKE